MIVFVRSASDRRRREDEGFPVSWSSLVLRRPPNPSSGQCRQYWLNKGRWKLTLHLCTCLLLVFWFCETLESSWFWGPSQTLDSLWYLSFGRFWSLRFLLGYLLSLDSVDFKVFIFFERFSCVTLVLHPITMKLEIKYDVPIQVREDSLFLSSIFPKSLSN